MRRLWRGLLLARALPLVQAHYRTGADLDSDRGLERSTGLQMAELVSQLLKPFDVDLPDRDVRLSAWLDRHEVPRGRLGMSCCVAVLADGRCGLTIGGGLVIEAVADSMVTVERPETDRYVAVYRLPRVYYGEVI